MPRPIPFNDDQLREAVRASTSLFGVSRRLGLTVGGQTYDMLRQQMRRLDLDAPHLRLAGQTRPTPARRQWTDDDLRELVQQSYSIAEVLRQLGYAPSGGIHRWVRAKITMLGVDTSHFTGQSWARGRKNPGGGRRARSLDEILVKGSMYSSAALRQRLIAAGLKSACCEMCGMDSWRGRPISLALDHINGDPTDNRLENLRILCPNCHAQTDTWCRQNSKHAKPA